MANSPQARKRARQNDKRREHNVSLLSNMRTMIKKVLKAVIAKDSTAATEALKVAIPTVDKAANKDLLKKRKASRIVSRLNAKVKALTA